MCNEPFVVMKNVQNILYSHWISVYLQLRLDKIQFKKIHKNWVYCHMYFAGTCVFSKYVYHKGVFRIKFLRIFKKTEIYLILMVDKLIFSDCINILGHSL